MEEKLIENLINIGLIYMCGIRGWLDENFSNKFLAILDYYKFSDWLKEIARIKIRCGM